VKAGSGILNLKTALGFAAFEPACHYESSACNQWLLRRVLLLVAVFALVLSGEHSLAFDGTVRPSERPMVFSIPAQPLASALKIFGQVSGLQVLYESRSAIGWQSRPVAGTYAPRAALALLLAGTDLKISFVRPDAVTVAPDEADLPPLLKDSGLAEGIDMQLGTLHVQGGLGAAPPLADYSERVRSDIQNALRSNARTRDGNYRVVLNVWINKMRTIERVDIAGSTGDPARDDAVIAVLRGITIGSAAPPTAPPPVRVSIAVRGL
jgi:hypothetical protein